MTIKQTGMAHKTVMITGASRGIGAAAVRVFAQAGANVALLARDRTAIEALAAQIGAQALAIECDVSRFEAVEDAVTQVVARFGGLDVLVSNAGVIAPIAPLAQTDPDDWGRAIDINLKGAYYCMRAVVPLMRRARKGTIITLSSGAAHSPLEGWSAYCASKAGAAMLTGVADRELRGEGLRIMGLSPGTVATDMQRSIRQSGINPVSQMEWSDHISPEWPARALLWMCSDDADDYIGQEVALRDEAIRARIGLI